MDKKDVIGGLEFTKAMITFNPSTGEDIEPENLNEEDKTTYDACVGAISLLKEQKELVRCADCRHAEVSQSGLIKCRGIFRSREWYCADGERRDDDA